MKVQFVNLCRPGAVLAATLVFASVVLPVAVAQTAPTAPTATGTVAQQAPKNDPDLNGRRFLDDQTGRVYVVIDGDAHWVPDPWTYNSLFRDWRGVEKVESIYTVPGVPPVGDPIPHGAVLAKSWDDTPVYLITDGAGPSTPGESFSVLNKRWIMTPAAMDKYHFAWSRVVVVPEIIIQAISAGANIS